MPSRTMLALAAATLLSALPAAAWEPQIVGLDDGTSPAAQVTVAAVDPATPGAPAWEPEIVGLDDGASAGAQVARGSVEPAASTNPTAFVLPTLVGSGS